MSAPLLLDTVQDSRAVMAYAFEEFLADGSDVMDDHFFLDSWFQVGGASRWHDNKLAALRTFRLKLAIDQPRPLSAAAVLPAI
jgi:hypothetical protein